MGYKALCSSACKYPEKSYWVLNNDIRKFNCEEKPLDSGYCIYHDPNYINPLNPDLDRNMNHLREEFTTKFKNLMDQDADMKFIGYILPGLCLEDYTIKNDIFFSYSKFSENITLKNLNFKKKCIFYHTKFQKGCSFHKCKFRYSKFDNSEFITTKKTTINNGVKTVWQGPHVSFSGSQFLDIASFRCIKNFSDEVYFNSCKFFKKVEFSYVAFCNVDFEGAQFFEEVSFFNCLIINGKLHSTTFEGQLHMNCVDADRLSFGQGKFNELFLAHSTIGSGSFWDSEFVQKISFETNYFGQMDFRQCRFHKRCEFKDTRVHSCDFSFAEFHDTVYFLQGYFLDFSRINFVKFEKPEQVFFQEIDLANVSFANTDISRLNFGDKVRFGGNDKNTIIEEVHLLRQSQDSTIEGPKVNLKTVLSVYRNLRENYEFRLRYDEAGVFFVKEMELKRIYKEINSDNPFQVVKRNWIRRNVLSVLSIYKIVSNYGESYLRPILVGIAISVFSMMLWITQSNPYIESNFPLFPN